MQTELLEAEVLWGDSIYPKFKPLFVLQEELYAEVYVRSELYDPKDREAFKVFREKQGEPRDILKDPLGKRTDPYAEEINAAVAEIEAYLKPHLSK